MPRFALLLVFLFIAPGFLAEAQYKFIEPYFKSCKLRIQSRDSKEHGWILETASSRAFARGEFILSPLDKLVPAHAFDKIDSLIVLHYIPGELVTSSRSTEGYGPLFSFVGVGENEQNILYRFTVIKHGAEHFLFGYKAPVKKSWGLLERFECMAGKVR